MGDTQNKDWMFFLPCIQPFCINANPCKDQNAIKFPPKVMHENTRLLILCGVHGHNDGRLGDREDKFVSSCEEQVEILQRKKSEEIEVKNHFL